VLNAAFVTFTLSPRFFIETDGLARQ